MANYNDGYIYNAIGQDGGFFYNGAAYFLLLRLHDTLRTVDNLSLKLASMILSEQFDMVYQELLMGALTGVTDDFSLEEESKYMTVFFLADQFGVKDTLSDLIVLAYLYDNVEILDAIRILATLIEVDEEVHTGTFSRAAVQTLFHDEATVEAFYKTLDSFGMGDNIDWVRLLVKMHENAFFTDGVPNPKLSITDWLIGVQGDLDTATDWFLPFSLKIDADNTVIATMPEAENITAELAGIDGSLWEDCTYRDRLFSITAYSEQGLTIHEKEELKTKITQILDSSKHKSKKLTIQDRGVSFDVKYTGQAEITEGPSFVKMQANLLATPYGTRSFESEILGSGLVDNGEGDTPLGPVVEITGYVSNPSFTLGEYSYSWNGIVQSGYKLVIDFNMLTCYLVDPNTKKTNAMNKFNGTFHKIERGYSEVMQVPTNIANKVNTRWKTRVLW